MMRRARLQIKPNVGPKPAGRLQASGDPPPKAKPPPVATPRQSTAEDGRSENFTQLKPAASGSAQPVGNANSEDGTATEKVTQASKSPSSHGPKTPKKTGSSDHPKLPHKTVGGDQGKSDGSTAVDSSPTKAQTIKVTNKPVAGEDSASIPPGPLSPTKLRSPRKSTSSEHPQTQPKSPGVAPAASADDAAPEQTQKKLSVGAADGSPVKKSSVPAVKPVLVRSVRSRLAKVRPNLTDAGKRGPRALSISEKKTQESEPAPKDQSDGRVCDGAKDTEAAHQDTEKATLSGLPDTEKATLSEVPDVSHASEERKEEAVKGGQTDTSPAEIPAPAVAPPQSSEGSVEGGGAVEGSEVGGSEADGSEACSASVYSSEVDREGPGNTSADPHTFATPDEKKKEEKKTRRLKPLLQATDAAPDRGKMKMGDLIYWNPTRNHMKKKERKTPEASASRTSVDTPASASSVSVEDEEASNHSDSMPVPQLKIGPDGNIILNMESLVMENDAGDPAEAQMETIEEDDDRFITCNSFRDNRQQKRWTNPETERFFIALSQVGTDFSLMSKLFPSRTRRDLKNKFTKEERRNRGRVDKSLRDRQTFDRSTFEKAIEEEEKEKRRLEAIEEDKKKRKRKRAIKVEKEALEDEEEGEEGGQGEEGGEERKENKLKRQRRKMAQDAGQYPAYKRSKRIKAAAGHTDEVAEILMNMSQGKVAAAAGGGKKEKEEYDDLIDDSSDTDSFVSHASSVDSSLFVPRVPRPSSSVSSPRGSSASPSCSSSRNVLVDSEAPASSALSVPVGNPYAAVPGQATLLWQKSPLGQAPGVCGAQASALGGQSFTVDQASLAGGAGAEGGGEGEGGSAVDLTQLVAGLQEQAGGQVDVVLVEQRGEGDAQGLVHVYLVPRGEGQGQGQQGSSYPGGEGHIIHPRDDDPIDLGGATLIHQEGETNIRRRGGGGTTHVHQGGDSRLHQQGGEGYSHQGSEGHSQQGGEGHSHQAGDGHSYQGGEGHSHQGGEGHSQQGGEGHSQQGGEGPGHQGGEGNSHQEGEGHGQREGEGEPTNKEGEEVCEEDTITNFSNPNDNLSREPILIDDEEEEEEAL